MLYSTLLQGQMFLVLLYFGILCGIVLTIKKLADRMTKQNKYFIVLTDILFVAICSFVFLFAKIKFCYGEFRLFEIISFCLGIFLEQISINNLVEKILKLLYNFFVKVFLKIKKFKIFKRLSK